VRAYSSQDVVRILGISPSRLRYWERTAFVRPSLEQDARPAFAFQDLVSLRAALSLLARGVPMQRIRRTVDGLRRRMPDLDRPLLRLRLLAEGREGMVVDHDGVLLEPDGQLVLDFRPPLDESVASLPGLGAASDADAALAFFERGCALDSEPRTFSEAIAAYRQALELDPDFADAHCNLGTVLYNQGRRVESRACFERALGLAPDHLEAHFNLANVLEEEDRNEGALRHYKDSLRIDPLFADAQLNLALLYEKLGLPRTARARWRRYLQLEPRGAWADIARKHLGEPQA
jgi:tetratricopeptide (TPR) repeat protein